MLQEHSFTITRFDTINYKAMIFNCVRVSLDVNSFSLFLYVSRLIIFFGTTNGKLMPAQNREDYPLPAIQLKREAFFYLSFNKIFHCPKLLVSKVAVAEWTCFSLRKMVFQALHTCKKNCRLSNYAPN